GRKRFENIAVLGTQRNTPHQKPPILSVSTPIAHFVFERLTRSKRCLPLFDVSLNVFRVNCIPPVQSNLFCLQARVLCETAICEFRRPVRKNGKRHRRHRFDHVSKLFFALADGLFGLFAIFNVSTGSVPFEDVAGFIPQRSGANQEPSIRTVETGRPGFVSDGVPGSQTRLPPLEKPLTVVRMNRFHPSPALRLSRGHSRVIEPHSIEEVAVSVRTSRP